MYEVVKVVQGHEILRMKGTRGIYKVIIREGKSFCAYQTFHSIKKAAKFIEERL